MSKIEETMNGITFETLVENAVKIPGVKVNRNEFLIKAFEGENVDIHKLIDDGPVASGVAKSKLDEIATKIVKIRTSESSIASFIAGVPGGLAYAVTIPADTIQFFGMCLRMTQEIAYIYGADNFWGNEQADSFVREQLIMYMGTLFDVNGAASGVRAVIANNDYQLEDGTWAKAVEVVSKELVKKLTTDTAAKGISKIIPVIGGLVSGSYTMITMQPMGNRLCDVMEEACFNYDDNKANADIDNLENVAQSMPVAETKVDDMFEKTEDAPSVSEVSGDVYEQLEKLGKLKDAGIITEEEFADKKKKLLDLI